MHRLVFSNRGKGRHQKGCAEPTRLTGLEVSEGSQARSALSGHPRLHTRPREAQRLAFLMNDVRLVSY